MIQMEYYGSYVKKSKKYRIKIKKYFMKHTSIYIYKHTYNTCIRTHVRGKGTHVNQAPQRERQGDSHKSSTPNVRGQGTRVNQAFQT